MCEIVQIEGPPQVARYSDMDMNGHINNVTYLGWALETVPRRVANDYSLHQVRAFETAEFICLPLYMMTRHMTAYNLCELCRRVLPLLVAGLSAVFWEGLSPLLRGNGCSLSRHAQAQSRPCTSFSVPVASITLHRLCLRMYCLGITRKPPCMGSASGAALL